MDRNPEILDVSPESKETGPTTGQILLIVFILIILIGIIVLFIRWMKSSRHPKTAVTILREVNDLGFGISNICVTASKIYGIPIDIFIIPDVHTVDHDLESMYQRGYRNIIGFVFSSDLALALPFIKRHPDVTIYSTGSNASSLATTDNIIRFLPSTKYDAYVMRRLLLGPEVSRQLSATSATVVTIPVRQLNTTEEKEQIRASLSKLQLSQTPLVFVQKNDLWSVDLANDLADIMIINTYVIDPNNPVDIRRVNDIVKALKPTQIVALFSDQLTVFLNAASPYLPQDGSVKYYTANGLDLNNIVFNTTIESFYQYVEPSVSLIPYGFAKPPFIYMYPEAIRYVAYGGQLDTGITGSLDFNTVGDRINMPYQFIEFRDGNWHPTNLLPVPILS